VVVEKLSLIQEEEVDMAAKFLHSLADDSLDLKKQIGCMTGIFHLFDRHHIISSPRITQKRLPPGNPLVVVGHVFNKFSFSAWLS